MRLYQGMPKYEIETEPYLNKLFRLLQRLERKLKKFVREIKKYEFIKIGKSSLASKLSWEALNMGAILQKICPGKVLRLMAGDVAAWHLSSGGGLDPDTKVWSEVPLPWELVTGDRYCTRSLVEEICRKYGVAPVKKGWTAPRTGKYVEAHRPTPELVHGVSLSSPELAGVLRKAGWFSGNHDKHAAPVVKDVDVYYDEHGFVIGAENSNSNNRQQRPGSKDS